MAPNVFRGKVQVDDAYLAETLLVASLVGIGEQGPVVASRLCR